MTSGAFRSAEPKVRRARYIYTKPSEDRTRVRSWGIAASSDNDGVEEVKNILHENEVIFFTTWRIM